MFSSIHEAFEDNPLGQQIKEYTKEQHKQSLINSVNKEQRMYNNYSGEHLSPYSDEHLPSYANNNHPFITAQGDVESFNKKGTRIADLKKDKDESSLGSILDDSLFSSEEASIESSFSDDTLLSHKTPYNMKDRTHEYYIRNFINDFNDNDSNASSKNNYKDTYDHIKTCKYCKDEIKLRMNGTDKKITNGSTVELNKQPTKKPTKYLTTKKEHQKSYLSEHNDIKEIVVVVLIGIVIIFLLDLFAKVSRTLGKK